MASTFWPEATLDVWLKEINHDPTSTALGQITITPEIECEVLPNGVIVNPVKILGIRIPHGGNWQKDVEIYPPNPGGYIGVGAPEGILRLTVKVTGSPSRLMGWTDAYFSLPPGTAGTTVKKEVTVLVIAETVPPNPPGAKLWFRFWVTSAC